MLTKRKRSVHRTCLKCGLLLPKASTIDYHLSCRPEVQQRLCKICDKPLSRNTIFDAHISCDTLKAKHREDDWYLPERVRKRSAQLAKMREERIAQAAFEAWERRQASATKHRIKIRNRESRSPYQGHVHRLHIPSEDVGEVFHCYMCLSYYPATSFYADRTRSSGLSSKCKNCADAMQELRRGRR